MKFTIASIAFATAVQSAWVEEPVLPEAPNVKYADITWEEYWKQMDAKTFEMASMTQTEVDELRGREEAEVPFWFNPDYIEPPFVEGAAPIEKVSEIYGKYNQVITGPFDKPVKDSVGLEYCALTMREPETYKQYNYDSDIIKRYCEWDGVDDRRCCTVAHDYFIKSKRHDYKEIWPQECNKDKIPGLKELHCIMCSPQQPFYTDYDQKIIRVCESVLKDIYKTNDKDKTNLSTPTQGYEKCGVWQEPDPKAEPLLENDFSQGWEIEQNDRYVVYPAGAFANAEYFMDSMSFAEVPFMTHMGYRIQAVPDYQEDGTTRNWCYLGAQALFASAIIVVSTSSMLLAF